MNSRYERPFFDKITKMKLEDTIFLSSYTKTTTQNCLPIKGWRTSIIDML